MNRSSRLKLAAVLLASLIVPGTAHGQDEAPITLRLAVADDAGAPSEPYVRAFIDAVEHRSGGTITVEPVWGAGRDAYEQGTARLLVDGGADLAMAAGRAWDAVGITSLMALQAPFLIDTDDLAVAVARSDVATTLLEGMAAGNVTGLAMWPEDLRHPVAFESCMAPIVAPGDLAGRTIRAIESGVTSALLEAMSARHVNSQDWRLDVETCGIQGAESGLAQGYSLPGVPTFTGDVSFFPKYQVLAANDAAFERLTARQQDSITNAALDTRDLAIAEHRSDVDAAREWCDAGGRVVLAGAESIAAFEAAARPLFERLATDPLIADAVGAIRSLKAATPPSVGVQACEPRPVASQPPAGMSARSAVPTDGTWRIDITREAMIGAGLSEPAVDSVVGLYTWTFGGDGDGQHGSFELFVERPGLPSIHCTGSYALQLEGVLKVTFTTGNDCGPGHSMSWVWTAGADATRATVDVVDADAIDTAMWVSAPFIRID